MVDIKRESELASAWAKAEDMCDDLRRQLADKEQEISNLAFGNLKAQYAASLLIAQLRKEIAELRGR